MDAPKGLVAVFTDERGNHIASATDFSPNRLGGFKMIEAQRHRVRESLAYAVMKAYASDMLLRAMKSSYQNTEILNTLVREFKCSIAIVPVGYSDEEASVL